MTSGIIFLDKPSGITSFQALGIIKKKLGQKKIGHAGTLDKFANGLVIALAGSFTRLNPFFTNLNKTYLAKIRFGIETETLDPEGKIIKEAQIPELDEVMAVIPGFIGFQMQVPPDFSAVHVDGKRAYQRKLAGDDLKIEPRKIEITELEFISWDAPCLTLRIVCSKGTYVRSIARDLGYAAGSCAYVQELKREKIGGFDLGLASEPEKFNSEENVIRGREVFKYLSAIEVAQVKTSFRDKILNGVPLGLDVFVEMVEVKDGLYALFHENDFLALIDISGNKINYKFVIGGNA